MASNSYLDETGVVHLWSKIKTDFAPKSTTLAGYGITDAKIVNGTITLGSNSITPITSHQNAFGKVHYVNMTGAATQGDIDASGNDTLSIVADDGLYLHTTGKTITFGVSGLTDKVDKSGDTMTGQLTIQDNNISIKSTSVDLTLANNGITENDWKYYRWRDKNNKASGYIGHCNYTNGNVRTNIFARNYKTDGTTYVDNGITLDVEQDGTRTVSVSVPAAWRSALGLGNAATYDAAVIEDNSSGSVSVAKNTWKTMNTLTLTKGIYVIQLYAEWASAKGYSRQIILSTSQNSGSALGYRFKDFRSILNNTSQCMNNVCFPLYVSATTTYYVNVNHNSDSAVNCVTRVAYFRLV